MSNNKFFYETDQYLSTDFSKSAAEVLVSENIDKLFNNKNALKHFKEEIYPAIKLAECLRIPYLKFCGLKGKSIDAELKNSDGTIIKVECTTSINGQYNSLVSEYNKKYGSCFIGPHSKAYTLDNIGKADSNDIVYSGTQHKREFVKQEELSNENSIKNCIVDINKYVKEDIEKIQAKINKGNQENKYKNFYLILVCEHNIDIQEVRQYQKLIYNYWNSLPQNPFSSLFVVNYDSLLFRQINYNPELNPGCVPVPLLLIKN